MKADPRFVRERQSRAAPVLAPRWEMADPAWRCPPAIEEWLRASRARLLRRYGGITVRSDATLARR